MRKAKSSLALFRHAWKVIREMQKKKCGNLTDEAISLITQLSRHFSLNFKFPDSLTNKRRLEKYDKSI